MKNPLPKKQAKDEWGEINWFNIPTATPKALDLILDDSSNNCEGITPVRRCLVDCGLCLANANNFWKNDFFHSLIAMNLSGKSITLKNARQIMVPTEGVEAKLEAFVTLHKPAS